MIAMNWTAIGLNWTVSWKCLEVTFVVTWRCINITELKLELNQAAHANSTQKGPQLGFKPGTFLVWGVSKLTSSFATYQYCAFSPQFSVVCWSLHVWTDTLAVKLTKDSRAMSYNGSIHSSVIYRMSWALLDMKSKIYTTCDLKANKSTVNSSEGQKSSVRTRNNSFCSGKPDTQELDHDLFTRPVSVVSNGTSLSAESFLFILHSHISWMNMHLGN